MTSKECEMSCPELRCGYEIVPKQKKVWDIELDLLRMFLDVCKRHDIEVQIFAGTLLGAIRHGGFIPWDDDMDVCMDRRNFKKLLQLPHDVFPYPYFLQTPYNDQHFYTEYARFRNSDTTGIIRWNNSPDYNNGIYIDVFVMDGKPPRFIEGLHYKLLSYAKILISRKRENKGIWARRTLKGFISGLMCSCLSLNACIRIHQFIMSLITPFTNRLTLMSHPRPFIKRYWLLKKELKDTVIVDFEGIKVPAPREYDKILSRIYGDYMKFPPASERGKWHEGKIYFDPYTPYKQTYEKGFQWS